MPTLTYEHTNTLKLGVLGSTNGTDLQAILGAITSGDLNAEVSVVISNRKNAYILERAENHNVPAMFISHKGKTREEFDAEMTSELNERSVELVLLIGFMRILSAEFCNTWRDRLLNVHPSLLKKCAVAPNDTVESLKTKVQKLEGLAFVESIKLIQSANG